MKEIFDEIENTILSFADDNNYKDSYTLFNIGKIEKMIDYCRHLQSNWNSLREIIKDLGIDYLLDKMNELEGNKDD